MSGILSWRTVRTVAPITLLFASAACSDDSKSLIAPEENSLKYIACEQQMTSVQPSYDESGYNSECGGGGGGGGGGEFSTTWDYYGNYYHYSGAYSTESDVDYMQSVAYTNDMYAFDEYSRDWSNPDAYAVAAWPAAVAVGVRAAVGAGRALARTTRFRSAVAAGARWATNVAAGVAASMLYGNFPLAYNQAVEDVPLSEFDFMFDYAAQ